MSRARTDLLTAKDRNMRKEERLIVGQNGSHITKKEQATLKQQENKAGKQIGE